MYGTRRRFAAPDIFLCRVFGKIPRLPFGFSSWRSSAVRRRETAGCVVSASWQISLQLVLSGVMEAMVLNSVLGNTLKRALSLFAPVQASPYQGAIPLAYRPDIDGLRAVAVCAVMLFHAFPHQVRSGFIGVDIFFVISGYLITSLLLQDIEQQKFSIVNFYKRRIRRILTPTARSTSFAII